MSGPKHQYNWLFGFPLEEDEVNEIISKKEIEKIKEIEERSKRIEKEIKNRSGNKNIEDLENG